MPKVQLLRTQKEISLKLPLTKMSLMKSKGLICVSAHIYMRTIHSLKQLNGLLSKEKALQKKDCTQSLNFNVYFSQVVLKHS